VEGNVETVHGIINAVIGTVGTIHEWLGISAAIKKQNVKTKCKTNVYEYVWFILKNKIKLHLIFGF